MATRADQWCSDMAALNTLTLCLVIAAFAASGALLNGVAGGGALAASPGDHANLHVSEMQGKSFEERAAQLAVQMTLAEKISQLDTNSPGVPRLGVTPFNWWQECLHGAQDWGTFQRGATLFPMPLALAATFDLDLMARVATAISDELRARDNLQFNATGKHVGTSAFAPNINIFRDPRWGRGAETYGEDPLLTGEMAMTFVRGIQGDHERYTKVGATCKHFAAYSLEQWEGVSRFAFDARLDPRDVEDTYLPAFRQCVSEAKALSVMCSYNAVNGTPACSSEWLLKEKLRGEMGFEGLVVSDCGALDNIWLPEHHAAANSSAEGAALALRAGTDLACLHYSALHEAVTQGLVAEEDVTRGATRVLLTRFKMGHFDPPEANPYSRIPGSALGDPRHRQLAAEVVSRSTVLLKNEVDTRTNKRTLPLDLASLSKITVIGPLANRSEYLLGSYYGHSWGPITTPLQAIREYVEANAAKGAAPVVDHLVGTEVMGITADVEGVVRGCRSADVCLFFLGTTMVEYDLQGRTRAGDYPILSTAVEGETYDRRSLLLPGTQLDLVQAAAKRTSATIVAVLVHGGPLDVEWLHLSPRVGAVMSVGFPGQGAAGLPPLLFGAASPSGRLPVTFYFNNYTRQIGMADMHMRPWPGRTHRFLQVPPLYSFGHGLSYATFDYHRLTLGAALGPGPGGVQLAVDVQNSGVMAAEEVVLVFLSYKGCDGAHVGPIGGASSNDGAGRPLAQQQAGDKGQWQQPQQHGREAGEVSVARLACGRPPRCRAEELAGSTTPAVPLQTLAAFRRVALAPGETARVELHIPTAQLAAAASGALEGNGVVACGEYEVRAGNAARRLLVEEGQKT